MKYCRVIIKTVGFRKVRLKNGVLVFASVNVLMIFIFLISKFLFVLLGLRAL